MGEEYLLSLSLIHYLGTLHAQFASEVLLPELASLLADKTSALRWRKGVGQPIGLFTKKFGAPCE